LNDKRIQQILEIEMQAQTTYQQAVDEAGALPLQAEKEAQAFIEKSRSEAEEEARKLLSNAQCEDECAQIQAEVQEKVHRAEILAAGNMDHAVSYVLSRVIGRE
jgi:vacuolar-type H+-ATPase subunit H